MRKVEEVLRRGSLAVLGVLLAVCPAVVLASMIPLDRANPWGANTPMGVTQISADVYRLHMAILWICVFIGVLVFGAMIWAIVRHRKSLGVEPARFSHSTRVEIAWTIVPVFILIGMAIPAAGTLIEMEDHSNADLTIQVTGYQWLWHYEYLGEEVEFFSRMDEESNAARRLRSGINPFDVENYLLDVDNPMVVPVGAKVRLLLTGGDVIHAWWIPDFAVKKDTIPGFVNEAWFRAEQTGVFRGQCTEFCGRDHAFMPIVVEVVTQEEYDAWLDERRGANGTPVAAN